MHTLTITASPVGSFLSEKTNDLGRQHFDLCASPLHLHGIDLLFASFSYSTVNCDTHFMEAMRECPKHLTKICVSPSLKDDIKTGDALVDSEI